MEDYVKGIILESFNSLVKTKSFDKITVKMISDEAGIGRATFYRHFKDKYDVMNYNFQLILERYFMSKNSETYEDLFREFLTIGLDKWSSLTKMFDTYGANSLHEYIFQASYKAAYFSLTNKVGEENITDEDRLRMSIFCHGIPFAYEEWIKGQYDLTPEEAAHAAMEIVPEKLKGKIWDN
ncbi:MAG: TetR/AcrR family transcriptional regulator [Clostridia bacterium]|nr:TetR/AcrR family transcriptional regulator [Clostridia bacterium]